MDRCIFITNFNFMRASNTVPPHHTQTFPTVHSATEPHPVLLLCLLLSAHRIYLTNSIFVRIASVLIFFVLSMACLNSYTALFSLPLCHACCLAMALLFQKIPCFSSFPLLLYSFRFPFLAGSEGLHTTHQGCCLTTGPDSPPASWGAWK